MSEHFEELEAELAALKPQQPSPRLQQRIADQLKGKPQATASGSLLLVRKITARRIVRLAVAAGLAACALAAFVLGHRSQKNVAEFPAETPRLPVASAFDEALPTVWTYQRALSHSAGELEALLDKHASLASPAAPTPNHLFIRSDRNLLLPGEL